MHTPQCPHTPLPPHTLCITPQTASPSAFTLGGSYNYPVILHRDRLILRNWRGWRFWISTCWWRFQITALTHCTIDSSTLISRLDEHWEKVGTPCNKAQLSLQSVPHWASKFWGKHQAALWTGAAAESLEELQEDAEFTRRPVGVPGGKSELLHQCPGLTLRCIFWPHITRLRKAWLVTCVEVGGVLYAAVIHLFISLFIYFSFLSRVFGCAAACRI